MPLELRNLQAFVEAARTGSFTAAGARLNISKAAVSKSVARLEKMLAVPLFVRTTRSLRLTIEGQMLQEELGQNFDAIESAVNHVGQRGKGASGVVHLSTVTAFGKYQILPLLPEFMELHPKIEIAISFHDGRRGLTREADDIRINWGEHLESGKVVRLLCKMPLALVGSPAYVARHGAPSRPQDLECHECIAVVLAAGMRGRWIFSRKGRQPYTHAPKGRIVIMDELDAVTEAAVNGLGLTVISVGNIEAQLRDGSLIRLLPDYEISGNDAFFTEVVLQYRRQKYLPAAVQALVDFLMLKLRDPVHADRRMQQK